MTHKQFYRVKQIAQMLSVNKSTIYKWIEEGKFPEGVRVSPNLRVWDKTDVDKYLDQFFKGEKA
jgi:prophage regulatory protein